MARLNWNAIGERFFEVGVDRGVLYIGDIGYAWPGLISVAESSSGGEPKPHYIDGYKYANIAASEEFEATIQAFSSPPQFAVCDGIGLIHTGLMATQQPRRQFGFSYRTRVGNDTEGVDHAYKIHLVYNALAAPSARANATLGENIAPGTLSWAISTQPPNISGLRPTSHYVVDSRSTPSDILSGFEDIIYGSDSTTARIPTVDELMGLFIGDVIDAGAYPQLVPPAIVLDGGMP